MNLHRLSLHCPAKLNLGLEVLRRDPESGYHEIATLLQSIGLCDRLELEVLEDAAGGTPQLEIRGPFAADAPVDGNSVLAAWAVMQGSTLFPALRLRLEKNIPAGSGLGGGSSDCAGLLLALRELAALLVFDAAQGSLPDWPNPESRLTAEQRLAGLRGIAALDDSALEQQALRCGSDAPFFVRGGCQLAAGRGERLSPVTRALDFSVVLAVPQLHSATSAAYRALERGTAPRAPMLVPAAARALEQGSWPLLERSLVNDFEPYLMQLWPPYGECFELLQAQGARAVLHTGSGSGFYGLFADRPAAEAACTALQQHAAASALQLRHCAVHAPLAQ
jgi:4-diphosphocytidyl-2-C-methyl-D-erythritol kinase